MVKKMKVLGLILELNPLHNGHNYFIKKSIDEVNPDYTVAIITSSFSMRGDINVVNKFERTKNLLDLGIDVVLELPVAYSLNNADVFGYTTVNILKKFKVTDLSFGVETNDLDKLMKLLTIQNSDEYNMQVANFISKGNSYPNSCYKAINIITGDEELSYFSTLPNNTLALQYLKNIGSITPHLISRINNQYYDENINSTSIQSATSLRKLLLDNEDISKYVPLKNNYINQKDAYDKLFTILKYQATRNIDFSKFLNCKEGIENRIINLIGESSNYDELVEKAKTKRYPPNRIKRVILSIILELESNYLDKDLYLRILGISSNGKRLVNSLNKETKKSIITSFKNLDDEIIQHEIKASKLYDIITNQNTIIEEYKVPIKEVNNDN